MGSHILHYKKEHFWVAYLGLSSSVVLSKTWADWTVYGLFTANEMMSTNRAGFAAASQVMMLICMTTERVV